MSTTVRPKSNSNGKPRTDKAWRPGKTLGKQNVSRIKSGNSAATGNKPSKARAWSEDQEQEKARPPPKKRARDEEEQTRVEQVDAPIESESEGEGEQDADSTAEVKPVKKGKRQNRKTGGTGKKQKVFVEQKNDMLSIVASITGQAEEKTKAKLERVRQRPVPEPKDPKQPSKAKQQQMDAARSVVAQRTKQKKDNKKADLAPLPPKVDDGKKRVSFA